MRICKVYEFRGQRKVGGSVRAEAHDELPALPVLPETRLFMELSVGESSVGLAEMTAVILRDLGATLQILRVADGEADSCEGCLNRLEDCISALGVQDCMRALTEEVSVRSGLRPEVRQAWEHARQIAEASKALVADETSALSERDAYLVGLFHELDELPALLGWEPRVAGRDVVALPRAWPIPECVRLYFQERRTAALQTPLSDLVRLAHIQLGLRHD